MLLRFLSLCWICKQELAGERKGSKGVFYFVIITSRKIHFTASCFMKWVSKMKMMTCVDVTNGFLCIENTYFWSHRTKVYNFIWLSMSFYLQHVPQINKILTQNDLVQKGLLEVILCSPLLKIGSYCSEPCPAKIWKSPKTVFPQPLWATWSRSFHPSCVLFSSLYAVRISLAVICNLCCPCFHSTPPRRFWFCLLQNSLLGNRDSKSLPLVCPLPSTSLRPLCASTQCMNNQLRVSDAAS